MPDDVQLVTPTPVVPPPVIEPVAEPSPEPVATEPAGEPIAVAPEPVPPKRTPWWQTRIDQLTREKHDERRRADAAASALQTALEHAQAVPEPTEPASTTTPPAPAPTPQGLSDAEINRRAEALANQRALQRSFDDACNRVADAGKSEYPDWSETLTTLGQMGGVPNAALEAITEAKDGHKLMDHLAKNPDEAMRIFALPPIRQAVEIARLETSLLAPKARAISATPPPAKPLGGAQRITADLRDDEPMADWAKKRIDQLRAKGRL